MNDGRGRTSRTHGYFVAAPLPVREHGPWLALAADPTSRFAGLLQVATEEVAP